MTRSHAQGWLGWLALAVLAGGCAGALPGYQTVSSRAAADARTVETRAWSPQPEPAPQVPPPPAPPPPTIPVEGPPPEPPIDLGGEAGNAIEARRPLSPQAPSSPPPSSPVAAPPLAPQPASWPDREPSAIAPAEFDARHQQIVILTDAVGRLREEVSRSYAYSQELLEETRRLRFEVRKLKGELGESQTENKRLRRRVDELERRLEEIGPPPEPVPEEGAAE